MPLIVNGVDYGDNWISPDDLDWSPIEQSTEYSLTGALIVEEHERQAGRPITLIGEWLTRAQVEALILLRDAGGPVTIVYRGASHNVHWRHADRAIEARALFDVAAPAAETEYEVTLRFIEI